MRGKQPHRPDVVDAEGHLFTGAAQVEGIPVEAGYLWHGHKTGWVQLGMLPESRRLRDCFGQYEHVHTPDRKKQKRKADFVLAESACMSLDACCSYLLILLFPFFFPFFFLFCFSF